MTNIESILELPMKLLPQWLIDMMTPDHPYYIPTLSMETLDKIFKAYWFNPNHLVDFYTLPTDEHKMYWENYEFYDHQWTYLEVRKEHFSEWKYIPDTYDNRQKEFYQFRTIRNCPRYLTRKSFIWYENKLYQIILEILFPKLKLQKVNYYKPDSNNFIYIDINDISFYCWLPELLSWDFEAARIRHESYHRWYYWINQKDQYIKRTKELYEDAKKLFTDIQLSKISEIKFIEDHTAVLPYTEFKISLNNVTIKANSIEWAKDEFYRLLKDPDSAEALISINHTRC